VLADEKYFVASRRTRRGTCDGLVRSCWGCCGWLGMAIQAFVSLHAVFCRVEGDHRRDAMNGELGIEVCMVDTLSKTERSHRMSLVRSEDTQPEMIVRSLVHGAGFRYRLHVACMPGKPDLVFPGRKKVIFVHGCFWHRHPARGCRLARIPKGRQDFWVPKLEGNRRRDAKIIRRLRRDGWKVLQIWECQLRDTSRLLSRVRQFLQ
jgi:DNA mismatch endonuclease (patch repair protein)